MLNDEPLEWLDDDGHDAGLSAKLAKLTVCPQQSWNYDYNTDPMVPALAHRAEQVK